MPHLSNDRVDVWLAGDDVADRRLLDRYRALLTEDERYQEQRFYFAPDRARYLVTRALVRTVLSRYADIRPGDWRFNRNRYGRPAVANGGAVARSISFNISHTSGLIVLGVTCGRALGVDVENVRTRAAALDVADSFFAPAEVRALRALGRELQHERFFEYWTLKEAYIKARGEGLSIPLDQFSFEFPTSRAIGVSFTERLADDPRRWLFRQMRPAADWIVAVCLERASRQLHELVVRRTLPLASDEDVVVTLTRWSE